MNRRSLLKAITAAIPAGFAVKLEAAPAAGDLVVIECPRDMLLEDEAIANLRVVVAQHLPAGVQALVLTEGITLRIERGVATLHRTVLDADDEAFLDRVADRLIRRIHIPPAVKRFDAS